MTSVSAHLGAPPPYLHVSNNQTSDMSLSIVDYLKFKLGRKNSNKTTSSTNVSSPRNHQASTPHSAVLAELSDSSPVRSRSGAMRPSVSASTHLRDPPPPYTETSASSASSPRSSSEDDRYAFLRTFDTVFILDDSGSMRGRSWRETKEALADIAPICTRYDADGIDIYFLNERREYPNVKSAVKVNEIFDTVIPRGGTPTGQRLHSILKPYLARYAANPKNTKPLNIIVVTDGEPTDDVESPIISAAKKLDKLDAPAWQIGIQFFQVGDEPGARRHLKELDDGLGELAGDDELRDIVDTVPYTVGEAVINAEGLLKVVLGSVIRRLDRSRVNLHSPR